MTIGDQPEHFQAYSIFAFPLSPPPKSVKQPIMLLVTLHTFPSFLTDSFWRQCTIFIIYSQWHHYRINVILTTSHLTWWETECSWHQGSIEPKVASRIPDNTGNNEHQLQQTLQAQYHASGDERWQWVLQIHHSNPRRNCKTSSGQDSSNHLQLLCQWPFHNTSKMVCLVIKENCTENELIIIKCSNPFVTPQQKKQSMPAQRKELKIFWLRLQTNK